MIQHHRMTDRHSLMATVIGNGYEFEDISVVGFGSSYSFTIIGVYSSSVDSLTRYFIYQSRTMGETQSHPTNDQDGIDAV